MNSIATLLEVYKMKELSKKTRISLIKKFGDAINHEYAMNLTDDIVEELVSLIEKEPNNTYENFELRKELANGIGDITEWKHRADVAEEALVQADMVEEVKE